MPYLSLPSSSGIFFHIKKETISLLNLDFLRRLIFFLVTFSLLTFYIRSFTNDEKIFILSINFKNPTE